MAIVLSVILAADLFATQSYAQIIAPLNFLIIVVDDLHYKAQWNHSFCTQSAMHQHAPTFNRQSIGTIHYQLL